MSNCRSSRDLDVPMPSECERHRRLFDLPVSSVPTERVHLHRDNQSLISLVHLFVNLMHSDYADDIREPRTDMEACEATCPSGGDLYKRLGAHLRLRAEQ
jgi:hypothetical protein